MGRSKDTLIFTTAIITYPSDYNGILTPELIKLKFNSIISDTTRIVVGKEDPDSEIERTHYHCYWDDRKQKQVSTNYFDIELPEPMVVFIFTDKKRIYRSLKEMEQELCWDNGEEMVARLQKYTEENGYEKYDVLKVAHPNLKLKQEYGDKYFMLKYVLKQKLVTQEKGKVDEDLKYLKDNKDELQMRAKELVENDDLIEINVDAIEELIYLLEKYKQKNDRKMKKRIKKRRRECGDDGDDNGEEYSPQWKFCQEIRCLLIKFPGITKNEVIEKIKQNEEFWYVYASSYLNYNKLITDLFKNKPFAKPTRHYEFTFWLPTPLYDYIQWLDKWVMNWMTGNKDHCEHRPKGLVLIGESRTGKTSLMSLIGDFSYFKNIWNSDNWEFIPPYTIMDDMDAQDEGKGLPFSWYKPWFGAQDAITITDKYRPKEDIINGKPLIWINNFDIRDTFPSEAAQRYIEANMVIVNIGNHSLFEEPDRRVLGNYFQYLPFDPKTTWFYQNIVSKQNIGMPEDEIERTWQWHDETEKTRRIVEQKNLEIDIESQLDEQLSNNNTCKKIKNRHEINESVACEKGRPSKRVRRED